MSDDGKRRLPLICPSRRQVMAAAGALAMLPAVPALAANPLLPELIARVTGGVMPKAGRIAMDLPRLSENGNSVPLRIQVESPMTADDHVRWVHVIAELNPYPDVTRFHLSPRAGRADMATSIRMADTQQIVVIAAMSDGSFWQAQQEVVVTLSACVSAG